ncbi:carboxylesterase/lipase family protein [Corynebacterium cystitidis]|uniref:carboxylesterase/lipase family protein n=1 Tax=Corynebacterium cystitidis TaxID=35757 RepID=UPI0027BAD43A|nr:carboxylesterase/lipase family protein [Corynebacterium cystitidis]
MPMIDHLHAGGADQPVVTTTAGDVRGVVDPTTGCLTWRGVPYGADTSGANRFRAPHPVRPWGGIRDCSEFAPPALQGTYSLVSKTLGSEDCLHLDIVRPNNEEELPVVVYFHGGSFLMGSSHEEVLQGHNLAKGARIVYVSVNFRLGVLGYLDLRSIGQDCVPNPALRDQILALQWVRDNIANFGGDPTNVTIMGESAGGASVIHLMSSPPAHGLFHRAVAQSPPIGSVHTRMQSAWWATRLLDMLGMSRLSTLDELREIEADELVRTGQAMTIRGGELMYFNSAFMPTVESATMPQHPLDSFAESHQAKVPLIIGTNSDEASFTKAFYVRTKKRHAAARRLLAVFDPSHTDSVLEAYGGAVERADFAELIADALFWAPAVSVATHHREVAPTWMYRFDYANSTMQLLGLGAIHASDLTAVFGAPGTTRVGKFDKLISTAGFEEVSERMQYHWGHFFHHGRPGGEWPEYTWRTENAPGRATAVFEAEPYVEYDPKSSKRRAWVDFDMTNWGEGRADIEQRVAHFLGMALDADS